MSKLRNNPSIQSPVYSRDSTPVRLFTDLRRLPHLIIFISLILGFMTAQAQAPAGLHRPATVPEGYVVTPFGYAHPSCVRQLAEGDTSQLDRGVIQHANGSREKLQACSYPRYTAKGEPASISATPGPESPTINGWVESTQAVTNTSYGEVYSLWTVPPAPTSNDGQTVYFFPGLEDTADNGSNSYTILQPVLGWTNGQWTIASWNCCYNGVQLYSSPKTVNPGDPIVGTISSTCAAGTLSCPTWNITTNVAAGASTTLTNTSSYGQTFNWAFGGVLEAYDIAQCSDYPPSGSLDFETSLYDNNLNGISNPGWSAVNSYSGYTPQCNYGAQAYTDGAVVDFGYAIQLYVEGSEQEACTKKNGVGGCIVYSTDYGNVSVTIDGQTYTASYNDSSTDTSIATALAGAIRASSGLTVETAAGDIFIPTTTCHTVSASSSTQDTFYFKNPSFEVGVVQPGCSP